MSIVSEETIKAIMGDTYDNPEAEEKVYADTKELSTSITSVQKSTVPDGYEGLIVSIAVSSDSTAIMYLSRDTKQYYENGLNCGALSHVPQSAGTAGLVGVGPEVPLLIRIKEKGAWDLGFKSSAGTPTINWRLRVRYFKKK
jgi:hypothetical protein